HPKPNAEFLNTAFAAFAADHPWVVRENLKPKSVAREIVESLTPFGSYVKEYGLMRSEGLLLRYLSEVYKTLVQTVPELARTPELDAATEYLGTIVRGVDSSLLDEWQRLRHPERLLDVNAAGFEPEPDADDITRDRRVFTVLVRNLMFSLVRSLATRDYESFLDAVEYGNAEYAQLDVERALRPLFDSGVSIDLDANARSPQNTTLSERDDDAWDVNQALLIAGEVSEYAIRGRIDLARSRRERRAVFLLDHVGA
ncbi:MAG TPA: DUF3516 domain-containing protein, partial [Polyangiaceae bacterium]|nr:DUF3516 domain-containing protein [Polyangiaceae bacterium]